MLRPEPLDFVIIALVALLVFGANRVPESARAIGRSIREFKDALAGKEVKAAQPPSAAQGPSAKS